MVKTGTFAIWLIVGIFLAFIIGGIVGRMAFPKTPPSGDTSFEKDLAEMFCIREDLGISNVRIDKLVSASGDTTGFDLICGTGQRKIISETSPGTQLFNLCAE